jgi:hypothetical protein
MNEISALCLPLRNIDVVDIGDKIASETPALRIAAPASLELTEGGPRRAFLVVLRSPDLVADLRRARAVRFADRYEWLALRRRRAQIAARHELEG